MKQEFTKISDILSNELFNQTKSSFAIKYSTIFSFWPEIVGTKYENTSKPLSIKGGKVFVSCKNSYVVQELMLNKHSILSKIKMYSDPLNVKIYDFVFEYKNWHIANEEFVPDVHINFLDEQKIEDVQIDIKEYSQVFENIDNSEFLSDSQKQMFKEKIIRIKKARTLQE